MPEKRRDFCGYADFQSIMNINRLPWKWFVWLVVFLFLLIMIVLPLLTPVLFRFNLATSGFTKLLDVCIQLQAFTFRVFTLVWIFFFGSCLASFLNVVAWRVPRGRSILGSSHCPYCNSKLAFRDNLPVVGWLGNRGRCRTCRLPISPRYLIAEVILGSVFVLMAVLVLNGGGINLPFRPTDKFRGFEQVLFDPKWDLVLLLVFHLTLICCLFTFALIKSDKLDIPLSLFLLPVFLGFGLPLIWTEMSLVNWHNGYDAAMADRGTIFATSLLGGSAGCLIGYLIGLLINQPTENQRRTLEFAWSLGVIGIFLGWQAVLAVSVIFLIVTVLSFVLNWSDIPQIKLMSFLSSNEFLLLMLATIIHLLIWRLQSKLPVWMNIDQPWNTLIAGVAALGILAFAVHRISPKLAIGDDKLVDNP